ncbi:nitroreductase family protein [Maridesulfovibrio sp.]|uniref:nitroreductase family protein n=1 Tax=Maridesulfovibrio sp. TaxID=2795000 RepID=UPI0039EE6A74
MKTNAILGVKDAILQRHSVRSFTSEAVSNEKIEALIEAARLAPSSLNSQPWRFKVVKDKEILKRFGEKNISRTQSWLAEAGAIIVCCADISGYVKDSQASAFFYRENDLITGDTMDGIDEYVERESSADAYAKFGSSAMNVGISISFMMLRAVELGLGTCWVGMYNEPEVKELANIDPELRIVGLLAVGYPSETPDQEHNRKEISDILLP